MQLMDVLIIHFGFSFLCSSFSLSENITVTYFHLFVPVNLARATCLAILRDSHIVFTFVYVRL